VRTRTEQAISFSRFFCEGEREKDRKRIKTHMVIRMLDAVVAQPAVTRSGRSVGLTSFAPCSSREGEGVSTRHADIQLHSALLIGVDSREEELRRSERREGAHLLATTPSLTLTYFGSAFHSPSPKPTPPSSSVAATNLRGGEGSRSRGRMPGSVRAVLSCAKGGVSESQGERKTV
jgi:hypothetical protein